MKTEGNRSRPSRALMTVATALVGMAIFASVSGAADRVYWANFVGPEPITFGEIGATSVSPLNVGSASVNVPFGTAIDPVGGRMYWASSNGGKIAFANLDGSGGGNLATGAATVDLPVGVATDPAAGKVYWANEDGDKISWAKTDGSGGEDLDTKGATVEDPSAIAVDPANGRVYWTNDTNPGSISYANLGGGGGGNLPISGSATLEFPLGLAIDTAANKIYWTNDNTTKISGANLDGSGSHDLSTTGVTVTGPYGLAVDPEAGRLYWGNTTGEFGIDFLRLDETGASRLPFAIPKGSAPEFPLVMKSPRATAAPELTSRPLNHGGPLKAKGNKKRNKAPSSPPGAILSCTQGTWAGDLVESFLYRAPVSISTQWTREGQDISGATGAQLIAEGVGDYRCRVTATNVAGSTAQLSQVEAVFSVGKAKLNKRKGTARLPVSLPAGPGTLTLAGKGIAGKVVTTAGPTKLLIRTRGKSRKALIRKGSAKLGAKLIFTPAEGTPVTQIARITVRKKTGRH